MDGCFSNLAIKMSWHAHLIEEIMHVRCSKKDKNLVHLVLVGNPGDEMQRFADCLQVRNASKNKEIETPVASVSRSSCLHDVAHHCLECFNSQYFLLRLSSKVRTDASKLVPFANYAQNLRKGVVTTTKPFAVKWLERCPTVLVFSKACPNLDLLTAPHRWAVWSLDGNGKKMVRFPMSKRKEYDWGDGAVPAILD